MKLRQWLYKIALSNQNFETLEKVGNFIHTLNINKHFIKNMKVLLSDKMIFYMWMYEIGLWQKIDDVHETQKSANEQRYFWNFLLQYLNEGVVLEKKVTSTTPLKIKIYPRDARRQASRTHSMDIKSYFTLFFGTPCIGHYISHFAMCVQGRIRSI